MIVAQCALPNVWAPEFYELHHEVPSVIDIHGNEAGKSCHSFIHKRQTCLNRTSQYN